MNGEHGAFTVDSEQATVDFGARLARDVVRPGMLVTLSGELGAGKTVLARAILQGLGATDVVNSPTFNLVQSYPVASGGAAHHFDLYRLESAAELEGIGFRDYLDGAAVVLVEWPQRAAGFLPPADVAVTLATVPGDAHARGLTLSVAPR